MFTLDTTPPVTNLTSSTYPYAGSSRSAAFAWTAADTQQVQPNVPACIQIRIWKVCRLWRGFV